MVTKQAVAAATEKQASDRTKFTFDPKAWPMGAVVKYSGTRVSEHAGQQGPIVGYRPTSGLWIKFPTGRGSVSVKQSELVAKGPAKAPQSKDATRTAKPKAPKPGKAASVKPAPAEPAKTA